MAVLLRTSLTSEEAAELLRRHVTAEAIDRIARRLEGPDPRLRAAPAGAIMFSRRRTTRAPDRTCGPEVRHPPPTADVRGRTGR